MRIQNIFIFFLTLYSLVTVGQTPEWKAVHKGNRAFEKKDYTSADLHYMNALKLGSAASTTLFNLGNVQLGMGNGQAALDYYEKAKHAAPVDTMLLSMMSHNQGYVYHASAMAQTDESQRQKSLHEAITHYKQALRLNPADDNTRYNLALCLKLLKDSQLQSQEQSEEKKQQHQQSDALQQQHQTQASQKDDKQMQQLLNLAKQAEKRAKERVDKAIKNRRQKNLEKNW